MKTTLKKRIVNKALFSVESVEVQIGWFSRLYKVAQRFEKNPTISNKALLLGYISSAEFVVNKLTKQINLWQ